MRNKLFGAVCLLGLAAFAGARHNSSEVQAAIAGALEELKFENLGGKMPGAPLKMQVTKETLAHLKKLMKKDKPFWVTAKGEITFKDPDKQ